MNALLSQKIVKKKSPYTHTWFGCHDGIKLLNFEKEDVVALRQQLYNLAKKDIVDSVEWNSITEKITYPFRFFVDLDWKFDQIKDSEDLKIKISNIVKDFVTIVEEAAGRKVICHLASRLCYKLHLHFPDVIISKQDAKRLCVLLKKCLEIKYSELYDDKVIDTSVYSTGLRLLWNHKGAMNKPKNLATEIALHEQKFGIGTYQSYYQLVDFDDLEPLKIDKAHMEWTSILTDNEQLTPLSNLPSTEVSSAAEKRTKIKIKDTSSCESINIPPILSNRLVSHFGKNMILSNSVKVYRESETMTFNVKDFRCPFIKRKHKSNHVYIVMSKSGFSMKCHDSDCQGKSDDFLSWEALSIEEQQSFNDTFGISMYADKERAKLVEEALEPLRDDFPKNRFSVDYERTSFDNMKAKLALQDKYCSICRIEHDNPCTYVECIPSGQLNLYCNLQEFSSGLPLTVVGRMPLNVIFQKHININITNNFMVESEPSKDFGNYDNFPKIMEDEEENQLLFESLVGTNRVVAYFAVKLLPDDYVYVNKQWYVYKKRGLWKAIDYPNEFISKNLIPVYRKVVGYFTRDPQQKKWVQNLIDLLNDSGKRKGYFVDMESILSETDERFIDIEFDANRSIIPFQNGIFDTSVRKFREHRKSDYITKLITYDFPERSNTTIRAQINQFFESIMPDNAVRSFLILYLALHLEGRNRHQIMAIFSGTGGNGKGIVKALMDHTFRHLHSEPSVTFLTSERPSDEKPSANMVNLRDKRVVVASEPESGKKMNGAFLKFLSGGDKIKCRENHSNKFYEYIPMFIVTMLCNGTPLIDDGGVDVRAIWRRLLIFEFSIEFVESEDAVLLPHQRKADPDLIDNLQTWAPEMMLMLTEVYSEYAENGFKLLIPKAVTKLVEEHRNDNSAFIQFMNERLHKTNDLNDRIHMHKLKDTYLRYLQETGKTKGLSTMSSQTFRNILETHRVHIAEKTSKIKGCCLGSTVTCLGYKLEVFTITEAD